MNHAEIDERSLAFGEHTARRLREQPELLMAAQAQLARWQNGCAPNVQAVLNEWQMILNVGLDATVEALTGRGERFVRLRQSAPFAGEQFIGRDERNTILRRFAA